jgi:broad specificity phosphatase PhoE
MVTDILETPIAVSRFIHSNMLITYLVHGTTTDNEQHRSSGWADVELSALGVEQSIKLKELLAGQRFDAVYCSDLKRAVATARLAFGDDVIADPRLREWNYGTYNGQTSEAVEPMQERCITEHFSEGESYEDVKERIAAFLTDAKTKHGDGHIAIVAHKAPQLALEVLANGKTWEQAFAEDWRKRGAWQPGWKYEV